METALQDQTSLQRLVRSAEIITGAPPPTIEELVTVPMYGLFMLLSSSRGYQRG